MLLLLSLLAAQAPAADITVNNITIQVVRIDGTKEGLNAGSTTVRRKNIPGGEHGVSIHSRLGGVIAEGRFEVADDEELILAFRKGDLVLIGRKPTKYKPGKGGGGGGAVEASPDAITLDKKGMLNNYAWVDGEAQGRVKNKKGLSVPVSDGLHEVWIALDDAAVFSFCSGLAEPGDTVEMSMKGCEGLNDGEPTRGTASKGAGATIKQSPDIRGWVSIDGGTSVATGARQTDLNLAPGSHTFTLSADAMGTNVYQQGSFSVTADAAHAISCSTRGCVGLDQPPTPFTVAPPPTMSSDSGSSSGGSSSGGGASDGGGSSSSSSNHSCCVNGAYYSCPTVSAVNQCSGNFMMCMADCGMTDFGCIEQCEKTHPIDPSACEREPAQDNSCG